LAVSGKEVRLAIKEFLRGTRRYRSAGKDDAMAVPQSYDASNERR
jgi:hypothetical protein